MMSRPKNISTVFNIRHQDKMILRVLKISDEGFMVNQHSKSVAKHKFELQSQPGLQQYIFSEQVFYT